MKPFSTRSRAAGLSMIAGAVALMVPPFLGPPNGSDSTRQRLNDLVANPNPTTAKSLAFELGVLLLLPGIASVVGRTRGRGTGAVISGACVYGAGLVGAFAFMVMTGVEVSLADKGPITSTLVDAADRMGSSPSAIPALILAFLCFDLIGLPWLTFGMVRARQIPWWLAVAATVGTVAGFVGSGSIVESIGRELIGVALVLVALTLVKPQMPALAPVLQPA